jgi:DNA-binding Lrp family transcriptional regulator
MDAPRPAALAQPQAATLPWWRIGRASLTFLLDLIAMGRAGGADIVDPLIITLVLDVNVSAISQDPELQRRYACVGDIPPDDLRRPISISATAASLRLPYETVRRRIAKLAKRGLCEVTREGVMIPSAAVNSAAYLWLATARYERLKRFYLDLKALGAIGALPPPTDPTPFPAEPVRLANRVISEYFLRFSDAIMRGLGDPVSGLLLLEMTRANSEHLSAAQKAYDGAIPDELRRPIRAHALARRAGLPSETVRRHLAKLEAEGFCRRAEGGLLADLEQVAARTAEGGGLAENLTNVNRMFGKLASLGVVAFWEAEAS